MARFLHLGAFHYSLKPLILKIVLRCSKCVMYRELDLQCYYNYNNNYYNYNNNYYNNNYYNYNSLRREACKVENT